MAQRKPSHLLLWMVALTGILPFATSSTCSSAHSLISEHSAAASGTDYNSGGTISVNGWSIVVPANLQVQFPAAFIPFKDFVASGFTGHEVSVSQHVWFSVTGFS